MRRHAAIVGTIVVILFLTHPSNAVAQAPSKPAKCTLTAARNDPRYLLARRVIDDRQTSLALDQLTRLVLQDMVVDRLLGEAQTLRFDKQLGAIDTAAGTTSLVSKATTSLLGVAIERGAIASSVSADGTTVTLSGKPLEAIRQSVMGLPYLSGSATDCDNALTRFVGKFAIAATFLADGGQAGQVPPAAGSAAPAQPAANQFNQNTLTSFSIRFEAVNRRDPRSSARGQQLMEIARLDDRALPADFSARLRQLLTAGGSTINALDAQIKSVVDSLPAASGTPSDAARRAQAEAEQKIMALVPSDPSVLDPYLQGIVQRYAALAQPGFLQEASRGYVATAEVNWNRGNVQTGPVWTGRGILGRSILAGYAEVTVNASASYFQTVPLARLATSLSERVGRHLRDAQVAVQGDFRLGSALKNIGAFSAGLRYEDLHQNVRVDPNSLAFTWDKANLVALQAKWVLPAKAGASITPFSLTWSNGQELPTNTPQSDLRGNVGVSLDLDSLLTQIKPH